MSQENLQDSCANSPNQHQQQHTRLQEVAELAPVARLLRTGTVRRASTISGKKERETSITVEDYDDVLFQQEKEKEKGEKPPPRRSLDNSLYRRSLESISEYRTKSSFSISLNPSRSEDSSSSDCTDYALRSTTSAPEEKTLQSPSSSYLSWIESVNSEYFGTATSSANEIVDVDNKVGEWNNFWLNYSSARGKYLSTQHLCASTEERTTDDLSDAKSTASTQKDFTDNKNSTELIVLSLDEIGEVLRLSQKVTEILQHAIRRSDPETDDSYYSQALSQHRNSLKDDLRKDRNLSFAIDSSQDLLQQKQKQLSKTAPQSTGGSCINALFNSGVADILKRVIAKRRDFIGSDDTSQQSPPRGSFSERSTTK